MIVQFRHVADKKLCKPVKDLLWSKAKNFCEWLPLILLIMRGSSKYTSWDNRSCVCWLFWQCYISILRFGRLYRISLIELNISGILYIDRLQFLGILWFWLLLISWIQMVHRNLSQTLEILPNLFEFLEGKIRSKPSWDNEVSCIFWIVCMFMWFCGMISYQQCRELSTKELYSFVVLWEPNFMVQQFFLVLSLKAENPLVSFFLLPLYFSKIY